MLELIFLVIHSGSRQGLVEYQGVQPYKIQAILSSMRDFLFTNIWKNISWKGFNLYYRMSKNKALLLISIFIFASCSVDSPQVKDITTLQNEILLLKWEIVFLSWSVGSLNDQIKNLNERLKASYEQNTELKKIIVTTHDAGEKIYINAEYGFTFNYPWNSIIESKPSNFDEYIRFENYTYQSESILWLADGEYYLEIFIKNREKWSIISNTCKDDIVEGKTITLWEYSWYRWLGQAWWDAGWKRFALCLENENIQFYVQATENSEKWLIANKILDSFKFLK